MASTGLVIVIVKNTFLDFARTTCNSICVLHILFLHEGIVMVWYVLLISYPLFALLDPF